MNIENRKAYHDYFIIEELECGIALKGHEVKSILDGKCNIKEAWCSITKENELIVSNMHISKYDNASDFDVKETRDRKLLAHKKEIIKLHSLTHEKGITIIPLKMYFKNGKCKVLIGICKGKKLYDKRESLKERDMKREMERGIK